MSEANADDVTTLQHDRRQRRRDKVVLISLVELLTILTFICVGFAFVTRDEVDLTVRYKDKYEEAQKRVDELETEVRGLNQQIEELNLLIRRLWQNYDGRPLPDNPDDIPDFINDELDEDEQEKAEGGELKCAVPSGNLFTIDARAGAAADEYTFRPAWGANENSAVRAIPGVSELAGRTLSRAQMSAAARRISEYGAGQRYRCNFRVRLVPSHESLRLAGEQKRHLEQFFWVQWP